MLLRDWDEYERWPKLTGVAEGSRPALETAAQVADALMRVAAAREVFEDIRKIDEDMLGAYCFGWSPQIEIYWMAHALFAGAFGLRMEDLSVVTLAHELAHAYIHIGRDIDGRTWVEPGFGESDRGVIEGLAQFYACVIAEKLRVRAPGVYEAYERLLEHQSGPYLAHTEWLKTERRNRGEAMRFALLCARTVGTTSKQAWHGMLEQARRQLREP